VIYDEVLRDLACPTLPLPVVRPDVERITEIKENIVDALDNLTAEVAKLKDVLTSSVEPTLGQLIPADKVQAQADALAELTAGLKASMDGAVSVPVDATSAGTDGAHDAPVGDAAAVIADPAAAVDTSVAVA
jgi:hypothetical protein